MGDPNLAFYRLAISVLLMSFALPLFAYDSKGDATSGSWFNRDTDGWHFYKEKIDRDEEPAEEPKPPAPPKIELPPPSPLVPVAPAGPPALSTEWLKVNLPKYRQAAMDNPSEANIKAYFALQKVSVDKATVFSEKASHYINGDFNLDENQRRSVNTFAGRIQNDIGNEKSEELIVKLSKTIGVFYFFDESKFSSSMNFVFDTFKRFYPDFAAVIISDATAQAHQAPFSPSIIRPNKGRSEQMGISQFPAIVLVAEDGRTQIVSQAAISLQALKTSIIDGAVKLGALTYDDLNSTRLYQVRPNDIPEIISNPSNDLPISPEEILKTVNRK